MRLWQRFIVSRSGAVLWVLLAAPPASAEDALTRGADRAIAAAKADDTATLAALARAEEPGGWLLAHELCARGESETALELARAAPGKDFEALPAYVEARVGKGDDAKTRGIMRVALAHFEREEVEECLTAIDGMEWQGNSVMETHLRVMQGYALAAAGREAEGADAFRAAALEAGRLGDLRSSAESHQIGAGILFKLGHFFAAHEICAHWVAAEHARGNPPGEVQSLESLSNVAEKLKNRASLIATYERLGVLYDGMGDRAAVAWTAACLATTLEAAGDKAGALRCVDRALEIAEASGDPKLLATILTTSGTLRLGFGGEMRRTGRAQLQRAFMLREKEDDPMTRAWAHLHVAQACDAAGEFAEAIPHLEVAEGVFGKSDHPVFGIVLNYLGAAYERMKEPAKALAYRRRAVAAAEARGDRTVLSMCIVGLGNTLLAAEDYEAALPVVRKGVDLTRELGDQDHQVAALWAHAYCLFRLGRPAEALAAVDLAVEIIRRIYSGLGDEEGAEARSKVTDIFALGAAAAHETGDVAKVFAFMEGGRAGTLLESLGGRGSLRANAIPEKLRADEDAARLALVQARGLHAEAVEARNFEKAKRRKQELDDAGAALEEVIQRIQRAAKSASGLLYPIPVSLKAAQAGLDAREALVLYSLVPEKATALVVTASDARIVPLGPRDEIVRTCEALRLQDSEERPEEPVAALQKLVIAPLGLGEKVGRLLVSPEGALCYVPLCVLAGEREVVYIPSATTCELLRASAAAAGEKVLALGDPQYRGSHAQLPHTRTEAEAVGDTLLLGEDATAAKLAAALASGTRWRAIHLACHGLIDLDQPTLSSLAITGGALSAYEVMRLDFSSDLVVLSACETGKGKVVSGEGLMGLTRAFMLAGAPRVMVSLWPVEDEATLALMKKFYELWKGGRPPATALRGAQEHVRSQPKWRHPFYWAAWQLWGLSR